MAQTMKTATNARRVSINCKQGDYTVSNVIDALQACVNGESEWVDVTLTFNTEADRDAFKAMFPKYVRWADGSMYGVASHPLPTAMFSFEFHANVAGDRNEAGEKRCRKVIAVLSTL